MNSASPSSASRRSPVFLLAVLVSTFILYVGTAAFGFVYDDLLQVLDNPAIRSWHLGGYFTTPVLQTPYYRPFFTLWLRLNYVFFGTHAAGWHIASVLLHVVATALVFFVARKVSKHEAVALVAALLFGVHPVHVESVAWVSGVCDPLYSVFFLGALLAHLKSQEETGTQWKAIALLLCGAALLSKEPAATFPAVVWIYEYLFREGRRGSRVLEAVKQAAPYAVLVVVYLIVRAIVTSGAQAAAAPTVAGGIALLTLPRVLLFYIVKSIWPTGLSAFYNPIYVDHPGVATLLLPILLLMALAAGVWVWARHSRDGRSIEFASLWFLFVLAPALNVHAFPYGEAAHDRYLYLPSAGLVILAALALQIVISRMGWTPSRFAIAAIVLAAPLAAVAFSQQLFWASDIVLYRRGVDVAPANTTVHNNLGRALADKGRFQDAEAVLTELAQSAPGNWQAHYNLGYVYYRTNRFAEAEEELVRAIQIFPRYGDVHLYLGLARYRQGMLRAAEQDLRDAIALAPARPGSHLALSLVLEAEGNLNGALEEVRQEMKYSGTSEATRSREAELAKKARLPTPAEPRTKN